MTTIANNGIIVISQGDTFEYHLYISLSTAPGATRYILKPTDIVRFEIVYPGVPEYNKDGELGEEIIPLDSILEHIYSEDGEEGHIIPTYDDDENMVIVFSSNEMSKLEPGTYYYKVVLNYTDDDNIQKVNTIIPRTKLSVVE